MDVNTITSHLENLANNTDAKTLSTLYNHIKVLLGEIKRGERPKKAPTPEQGDAPAAQSTPYEATSTVQSPGGGFGSSITNAASTYNNRKIKVANDNKKGF